MADMWSNFTPESRRAILAAQTEAQREGRREVSPAHLLLGALDHSAASPDSTGLSPNFAWTDESGEPDIDEDGLTQTAAAHLLEALEADPGLVRLALQSRLRTAPAPRSAAPGGVATKDIKLSKASRNVLSFAADEARRLGAKHIGTEHILLGVACARWASMTWYLVLLWPLHQLKFIPQSTLLKFWHRSDPLNTAVAEVLAEFKLGLDALRLQAGNSQTDAPIATPWTGETQRAVAAAQKEARATGAGRVGAEHLWLGLLADSTNAAVHKLQAAEIPLDLLSKPLRASLLSDNETPGVKQRYTPEARRAFAAAARVARAARAQEVGSDHLLIALAGEGGQRAETTLERASKVIAAEPPSRAAATISRALRQAGLPEDYLRQKLQDQTRSRTNSLRGADAVTRVTAIVAEELYLPFEDVTAETRLMALSQSHLVVLDIFKRCSKDFGVAFTPAEVKSITTAGALANAVVEKVMKNGRSKPETARLPKNDWLGTLIYSLPFVAWAFAMERNSYTLQSVFLVAIPLAIYLTSPGGRYGQTMTEGRRMLCYFGGMALFVCLLVING